MKILLAAKHVPNGPRPIGGVQTWIATVASQLESLGHNVAIWGPELGAVPNESFDFGIIANAKDTERAWQHCSFVLNVSHGIIDAECPSADADAWAFTSEGVRDHWDLVFADSDDLPPSDWFADSPIIRQPIDCEFWQPGRGRRRVVRYSYRGGLPTLDTAARRLGYVYAHVRNVDAEQARAELQGAACVVATGRAALEAMALGVPVLIADHRAAYQPPLMNYGPIEEQAENNYSGRGPSSVSHPHAYSLRLGIESAMTRGSLREYVTTNHDAKKITKEILQCCQ